MRAVKAWYKAEESVVPLLAERDKATGKHGESEKKKEAAQKAVTDSQAQIAVKRETARTLAEAALRASEVVKKLPNDKELTGAAAIFLKRSTATAAELSELEKGLPAKTAALKKADLELIAAGQAILTARSKVSPVRELVRQQEKVALYARRKMAETRSSAEEHQKRVKLLETTAHYQKLEQQIAAGDRDSARLRSALVEARKNLAALERHQKITTSVRGAGAATAAARELLPEDLALSQAAQKLSEKCVELQKAGDVLQSTADASLQSLAKTTERVESAAGRALPGSAGAKARAESVLSAAAAALADLETRAKAARTELAEAANELSALRGNQFAQAQLKPLTPEQMCWSILKVTGVYDRYRKPRRRSSTRRSRCSAAAANDPLEKLAREIELEQRTFDKFKGNLPPFIAIYAAAPGQPQNDFFATADQALFAANGGSINSWIAPAGGNVSERMVQESDPRKAAVDLYMTILIRRLISRRIGRRGPHPRGPAKDKPAAVQELVWGLLTSAEFRFNH